jgi:hypothetical protein
MAFTLAGPYFCLQPNFHVSSCLTLLTTHDILEFVIPLVLAFSDFCFGWSASLSVQFTQDISALNVSPLLMLLFLLQI